MLRPGGYAILVDPSLPGPVEADTFSCSHCNSIVFCRATPGMPRPDAGGFCRLCYKHICGACADKGSCDPFEKQLERQEQRARFLHALE